MKTNMVSLLCCLKVHQYCVNVYDGGRSFSFLHACHFRCTRAFQFDDGDPGTVPQVLGKAIRGIPPAGRGLRPGSS